MTAVANPNAVPETASFSEFAKIMRMKPSYVTELRKGGRLVLTEDTRRVRVAESRALIEATRDPSRAGVAARHAATRAATEATAADVDETAGQDAGARDEPSPPPESPYHEHRAENERWKAATSRREFEVSIGKLRYADEVEAALARAGVEFRRALERLPDDVSPELAALSSEAAVRARLQDAVHHILHELARDLDAAAKARAE